MPDTAKDEKESRAKILLKQVKWRDMLIALMKEFNVKTGIDLYVPSDDSYIAIENRLIHTIEETYKNQSGKPDLEPSGAKVGGHLFHLLGALKPIKLRKPDTIKQKDLEVYTKLINIHLGWVMLQLICQHTYYERLAKLGLIKDDDLVIELDKPIYRDVRYLYSVSQCFRVVILNVGEVALRKQGLRSQVKNLLELGKSDTFSEILHLSC